MRISAARLAADRRYAAKSTGPTTPEGKATARLNAVRHGMSGGGNILLPGDSPDLVAARITRLRVELHPSDLASEILIRRVAVLSVRMERLADRELHAVAADFADAEAEAEFDRALLGQLRAPIERFEAEPGAAAALAPGRAAIAASRREAGQLASFHPSPEATLARRYEAAERGMYRALRGLATIRRDQEAMTPTPPLGSAPRRPRPRVAPGLAPRSPRSPPRS